MKKLIITIGLLIYSIQPVMAQNLDDWLDQVLPRPGETNKDTATKHPETGYVADLPEVSIEGAVTATIRTILGWAMLITLVTLVVSAIYYIQSRGNEEDLSKTKNMILYLIIGMAIMAAAYGIITGLSQFEFFGP